ncbi:hypothetical protein SAMN05444162_1786 [Paenibacillaceae bacterium GAS479]|nr:hypothetical protein SAMN05444162_1786 [Paenibacillaceae bacterium GAS479]
MISHLIYILLGLFDALATWVLAFSLFRIPIFRHWVVLLGSSLAITLVSYFNRMVMNWSVFDLPTHFIIFTFTAVFILKFRLFWAMLIISSGYMLFLPLQFTLYILLTKLDFLPASVVMDNTGLIFLLQILTDSIAFLFGIVMVLANKGFRFIPDAPHSFNEKLHYLSPKYEMLFIALATGMINIAFSLFLSLNGWVTFSYACSVIAMGSMLYLFYQNEKKGQGEGQGDAGAIIDNMRSKN